MKEPSTVLRSMALAMAAAFATAAAQAQPMPAKQYECTGTNVSARYVQSGLASQLTVQLKHTMFQSGEAGPHEEVTVLGNLLTLTTNAVPDAYTDTVTLLLPDVSVDGSQPLTFRTWLYTTRTITSIGGPQVTTGVIQSSRSVGVSCTAKASPM